METEPTRFESTSNNNILTRREFVQRSALGVATVALGKYPTMEPKSKRMGIVVHSYASRWNPKTSSTQFPGFTNALDLMEHCHEIGAGGLQTTIRDWTSGLSRKLRNQSEKWGMFLEGSIGLPHGPEEVERFEKEVMAAREAGVSVIRTVCMNGRRYENFHTAEAIQKFKKESVASLQLAEPIVLKQKMRLAIENHKDWRADELAALIKQLNSEWIGVTLDFGNSIALLEDPLEVVKTLAPYLMSTHVKDMGVQEYGDGFLLSEVPLGEGILDLPQIVSICREHNPNVNFNLEMITRDPLEIPCLQKEYWPAMEVVKGKDLAGTLRLVREKRYKTELPRVAQLSNDDRLIVEEKNILDSLNYSKSKLGMA